MLLLSVILTLSVVVIHSVREPLNSLHSQLRGKIAVERTGGPSLETEEQITQPIYILTYKGLGGPSLETEEQITQPIYILTYKGLGAPP